MTHHPHHTLPIAVPPANRFTILVIDDETPLRTVICRSLDRIGYTTVQAKSPMEALELLQSGEIQPDLVLTDVEMPGMTGIEMVSRIRSFGAAVSTLPIIVASGNPSKEMRRQAIDAGADLFMTKPFELAELYAEVGSLLREIQHSGRNDAARTTSSGMVIANRLDANQRIKKTV